jgi:hypothetical protein
VADFSVHGSEPPRFMKGRESPAERMPASQEGLCCMGLVKIIYSDLIIMCSFECLIFSFSC